MRTYLLSFLLFISLPSFAQSVIWSAPVSVAASSFGNMHPRIALNRYNDPVVVWGSASMDGQAMFAHWNGTGFSTPVTLNPSGVPVFTWSWAGPDIAAKGDTVYVVMKAQPEDTGKMYITRSFNGGHTWSSPIPFAVTDTGRFPVVTTDAAGHPTVGYMRFSPTVPGTHYIVATSGDYGASFAPSVFASNKAGEVCDCCPASVVRNGNTVIMLYRNALSNVRTIWARISKDGGNTFSDSLEVDNTNWTVMSCPSSGPDGFAIGDTLYTVFRSSASGTRAYLSKSSISSPQLIYSQQLTPNFTGLSQQDYPRIANAGNAAAMVWKQVVNGRSKLCFALTDNIHNGFPSTYDTLAVSGVDNADIAITGNTIHIVWEDLNTGTVMYRKGVYFPVSVPNVSAKTKRIAVYPNPAHEYFTVSTGEVGDMSGCWLIDNAGRMIPLTPDRADNELSFSLKGVSRGIYTVQITNKQGNLYSAKLLVK